MLVQLLAVEHAAVPAASGQQLHGLNAALGRALCMSKDLKRCRDQRVRGQQGRSLAKLLVAARASAAEIIRASTSTRPSMSSVWISVHVRSLRTFFWISSWLSAKMCIRDRYMYV